MSETLSNLGTQKVDATEQTNVTGQMTSVLDLSPKDGLVLILSNMAGRGFPVYFEPRDSNGDLLPLDTEVAIRYDAPRFDQPQVVSYKLSNIQVYRSLSIKEQQNEEYRDRTRIELKGPELEVRDIDNVQVAIDSSAQIDWNESRLYIDERAVTVRSEG